MNKSNNMLWVAMLPLIALIWIGPAGWLRADDSDAIEAEQAADLAEENALTPPPLTLEQSEAVFTQLETLRLRPYDSRATFWDDFLRGDAQVDPPAGLQLEQFTASEPEQAAPGVQRRLITTIYKVDLEYPFTVHSDSGAPSAPGGHTQTMSWALSLNSRVDMRLEQLDISTTGAVTARFTAWLLDALPPPELPEPDPASEAEPGTEPDPASETDPGSEPEPGTEPDPASETDPGSEPEPGTEPDPASESEPGTEPETRPETQEVPG